MGFVINLITSPSSSFYPPGHYVKAIPEINWIKLNSILPGLPFSESLLHVVWEFLVSSSFAHLMATFSSPTISSESQCVCRTNLLAKVILEALDQPCLLVDCCWNRTKCYKFSWVFWFLGTAKVGGWCWQQRASSARCIDNNFILLLDWMQGSEWVGVWLDVCLEFK